LTFTDESSQDRSTADSTAGGGGGEPPSRERKTKLRLAVACAEWALVRARMAWDQLLKQVYLKAAYTNTKK
jgi:hypothetical protein